MGNERADFDLNLKKCQPDLCEVAYCLSAGFALQFFKLSKRGFFMSLDNTPLSFGAIHKFLHWGIAVLMIGLLAVGIYMVDLPSTPEKFEIYGIHKATGMLVFALVIFRIFWRFYQTIPRPIHMSLFESIIAKTVHLGLYMVMVGMPITGWGMSSAGGYDISFYGLFTVPPLVDKSPELGRIFHQGHEVLGWVAIVMIALHVLGALKHHFVAKDDTLRRMI